jgi:uncharacterized tellurite resistance protein B-like protein
METTPNKDFYINLSSLYYAMGMADRKFVREEKLQVIELVKKNWQVSNADLNIEEIMFNQLKNLVDSNVNSANAYEQFNAYFAANNAVFTPAYRKQILEDIYAIAAAFAKRNKSELVLYSRVLNLFFP